MAVLNAPDATSGPAKAVHAGVNARVASYTLAVTASASQAINMFPLPGGARVVGATLTHTDPIEGGAATNGLVSVQDGFGNIYIASVSAANAVYHTMSPTHGANGPRLTSSSNLRVVLGGFGSTGSAATTFTLTALYLADEEPD